MADRTSFFRAFRIAAFCFALTGPLLLPALALAVDEVVPEVENSRNRFLGEVTDNAVQVRSGPGTTFYATQRLDKHAQVTVVGIKFDWLKILPPDGSFSYIGKAYVDRRNAGQIGRTNDTAVVRAGSSLFQVKTTVQTKLAKGVDVTIVGEQEEYYKIKPPEGAYVYINKQFVKPLHAIANPEAGIVDAVKPAGETDAPIETSTPDITAGKQPVAGDQAEAAASRTGAEPATAAATEATSPAAVAEFEKLEAEFEAASIKEIGEQPLSDMLEGYEKLMQTGGLPDGSRRVAEARLAAIKIRTDARDQYLAVRKTQAESAERRKALEAEREEIDQRIKQSGVEVYTAVGTLRLSSLQSGSTTLYRLTDPSTGRTVVYLRTNDPEYVTKINTFVGVRGEVGTDARLNLKVITPTETAAVDPTKVNTTVLAQIVPPSLVPGVTASTGQE